MSELARALETTGQESYADVLRDLSPRDAEDAKAIGRALRGLSSRDQSRRRIFSDLHALTSLFQEAGEEEAVEAMRSHALPELIEAFDRAAAKGADVDDLLFVLKILAMYGGPEALRRVAEGARRFPDGYLWGVIFQTLEIHPEALLAIVEQLRDPLPSGEAAAAYLDVCNSLCRSRKLRRHPFDTPEGHARLRDGLSGPDESYAHSAAAALAFVEPQAREPLLQEAMSHSDVAVQMEATWASAHLGDRAAVSRLIDWCDRPQTCWRAETYLSELGLDHEIPLSTKAPEFRALVEMCEWLEHPLEIGKAPDEIEIADSRELLWPPTDDRRRVHALRYLYRGAGDDGEDDAGYGMVGSVTFALFGEATADLAPLEVYALHCCRELEWNDDPRAPGEASIEAGLRILRQYNDDLEA